MAKTAFATDNALTKKLYDEKLFRDSVKEAYFNKFMGTTSDSLIMEKTELTKSKGDNVVMGLRMRLSGTGVTSGQALEGAEEKLVTYSQNVSLEQYRHAVRDDGEMSRQRAMFSIDEESQNALKSWGTEKIDQLLFDALFSGFTKVFYQISGTVAHANSLALARTKCTVAANSLLTPKLISAMKTYARTGGARNGLNTPLRPISVEGKKYYVLLVHPDALFDLKQDSTFATAMREAQERGPSNPLFQGSTAIWDGVVIHEHENVPIITTGGGGAVPMSDGIFMGAQSGLFAWGKRPEVKTKKFDYDNENGYAWGMIAKAAKSTFNSQDFGCFGVALARTRISDSAVVTS
jgi:N4-gp56 family major capsid protein